MSSVNQNITFRFISFLNDLLGMEKCEEKKGKNSELIEALGRIIKNVSHLTDEEIKSSIGEEMNNTENISA